MTERLVNVFAALSLARSASLSAGLLSMVACASDAPASQGNLEPRDGSMGAAARDGGSMHEIPEASVPPEAAVPVLSAQERAALEALSPSRLPSPPPDLTNRFADEPAAAALGQKLFMDPGFSGALIDGDNDGSKHALGVRGQTGRVSCAGCHLPMAGFSDTRTLGGAISLGAGWGRRRTPSLLDVGQAKILMWDGRHDALFNQVFGPIESAVEMNSSRLYVAEQLFARYRSEYEAVFGPLPPLDDASRFPPLSAELTGCQHVDNAPTPPVCDGIKHGMPGDGAEFDGMTPEDQEAVTRVVVNYGKAIGAYERLLSCGPSRFDAFMHGKMDALSAAEQRGAALFVGKAHCVDCHSGPYLSDQKFHNVGLRAVTVSLVFTAQNDPGAALGFAAALADPLNVKGHFSDADDGRLPSSVDETFMGAFRTPALRCVGERPRFMHTGQMFNLEQVVAFFSRGGDSGGYPGDSELRPLDLHADEQADLVQFLRALTGPGPAAELLK